MNMKLNLKYASEILEGIESLPKGSIVLAKCQTMTGKTTAILGNNEANIKGLIDKIGDKTLIYLCNRIALKRQIKLDLCNKYNIPIKTKDGSIDYEWLDKLEEIQNVTIMSYQSLEEKVRKRDIFKAKCDYSYKCDIFELNYDYIVADEFHYVLRDASFNSKTRLTFNELNKCWHSNSVLIYMTATDFEVKDVIEAQVQKISDLMDGVIDNFKDKYYRYYDGGIDYSYCNIKYFKKYKDIITTIKNSDNNEKWIWFSSSIDGAEKRLNLLKEANISSEFISAKDNEEIKNEIIETSQFNCKVLVTTSVLDNGVNIKDDKLVNIVIESFDSITFIQELGRKRMALNNISNINLYIPMRNSSNFTLKIENIQKEVKLIELFNTDKAKFKKLTDYNISKLGNAFYFDEHDNLKVNETYYARCLKDIAKFTEYSKLLEADEWFFVKEQLRWLELEHTFNVGNLIENVVDVMEVNKLEEFLKVSYEDNVYFTKESFRETIDNIINNDSRLLNIMNMLDGKHTREKGQKIYNKLFEKCNIEYMVGSVPQYEYKCGKRVKKTYWRIVKEN